MPVTKLVFSGTTYYVIGTAHVSHHSVEEVRTAIAELAPEVVCVELDRARYDALTGSFAFRDLDVIKVVREGRALYLLAQLALSAYQRRLGATLGVRPGAELRAAVDAANAAGIPIELIDRNLDITLKRTWRNLGLWRRASLLAALVVGLAPRGTGDPPITSETIEGLKQPKALAEMLAELGRAVPEIKVTLIDERDRYLASKLGDAGAGRRTVVAVVGAAHVPGIQASLGAVIDRAELERVPPPALAWRIARSLVPLLFITALAWGWRRGDATRLLEMTLAWILPTSIAAGGCTLLAGGSLRAIAAAMVVSPVAALHPRLRTGRVVGVVEASRRRPSAADRARLPDDVQSLRGFWRNPVTRVLLIAVASSVGTAVGCWIAMGWVVSLL